MRSMRRLALVLLVFAAAPASAAAQAPFGHACTPQNGVRVCPTAELTDRVASWDGTPIDVDVTLPPEGAGPFPTIVMEHGFPGTKASFQATAPEGDGGATYHFNNVFYAQNGFAVVTHSARGFGRSCGTPESRTAGCERGWTHIADHRYEVRDTQHLLGLLVDQGVTAPAAIGITGISGGGGRTIAAAFLRDRVRVSSTSFVPWTSPAGTPLRFSAAFARWGWSDLANALTPNGRLGDRTLASGDESIEPIGVAKHRWIELLLLGAGAAGFIAPPGADATADLTSWRDQLFAGEPYRDDARATVTSVRNHIGGMAGLSGSSAPLLLENGWGDDLFPVDEATRVYERIKAADRQADVGLLLGDLGHGRAGNAPAVDRDFNDRGFAFLRGHLTGTPVGDPGVRAYTVACPAGSVGKVYSASSWRTLAKGRVLLQAPRERKLTSKGGSAALAKELGETSDPCLSVARRREANTATYEGISKGFTLLGAPAVSARITTTGANGQIAARLWHVAGGRQRLVTRGVYRLRDGQTGKLTFKLHPGAWRFAKGSRFKLELLGRDAPYAQASRGAFDVRVRRLALALPTAEKPSKRRAILQP
jgi:pimeloyl-ACP methyl ester carboxylesterase